MTDKEKKAMVDSFKEEFEEMKRHRRPSGEKDNLAIEIMQIKQRTEPTLDVYSNRDVVVEGEKDGVIKVKDNQKAESQKQESEKNKTKEIGD